VTTETDEGDDAVETEDTEDGDGQDEGDEEEVEEEIELNFGGDKLRVPKSAIPEDVVAKITDFSRNLESGYTKKFQTLAEQRESVAAREQAVERLATLDGEALDKFSRGNALKQEIAQLQNVNTQALWQSNPDQARRISDTIAKKQAEFNAVVNEVSRLEGERSKAQEAELARREEEGRREVEKRIPGFAEKHAPELVKYAISQGIPEAEAGKWTRNPIVTEMAWKAMQYDAAKTRTAQAVKPKPAGATPIRPSKGKGGKPKLDLVQDADKMSADEWARRRNLQLSNRA